MNLCVKCAQHERTCCQDTDVLVTDADIGRIEASVGRADFWEYRVPSDPENRREYPGDPNWLLYTVRPDGTRAQLKQQRSRDCTFLAADGCTLPRDARPLTCRLYPHDYDENRLNGHHNACPVRFLAPGQGLFDAIGIREDDAERWRAQLYGELRDGSVYRENLAARSGGRGVALQAMTGTRITVLHGYVPPDAPAEERDTLVQVEAVAGALRELGHDVTTLPFGSDPAETASALREQRPAVVFNLVESIAGLGRGIEAAPNLVTSLGLRHTGAPPAAILETTNKVTAKRTLALAGIPTPPWMVPNGDPRELPAFSGPYIVKSVWEHASVGLEDGGVVPERSDVVQLFERRRGARGSPWFVERYVEGREFAASLLAQPGDPENPLLVAVAEMVFDGYPAGKPRIIGYAAKWDAGSFEYHHTGRRFLASQDEPEIARLIAEIARRVWTVFGLRGYARVDFRLDGDGQPWVLDVNANPCIAPDSGFIAAAEHRGMTFTDVIRRILEDA